ncbi:MAG TPA: hypothetical protein V6D05_18235 [Stenomitos sp.]
MLIFVAIAFVGGLCVMAGLTGWQAGSADLPEVVLNLGIGLTAIVGAGYAFVGRRKPR